MNQSIHRAAFPLQRVKCLTSVIIKMVQQNRQRYRQTRSQPLLSPSLRPKMPTSPTFANQFTSTWRWHKYNKERILLQHLRWQLSLNQTTASCSWTTNNGYMILYQWKRRLLQSGASLLKKTFTIQPKSFSMPINPNLRWRGASCSLKWRDQTR